MNKQRPINLDLTSIHFPVTSISSILHRISGVLLVIGVPILFWLFGQSLESRAGYEQTLEYIGSGFGKFIFWAILSSLLFHIIAGVRHLFMDAGIGESLQGGLIGARLVLLVSTFVIVGLGVWLW